MKNIAIILAGGIGRRFEETLPKPFQKVAGKKIIEHTLDAFQNHPLIDEICIVIHPDYERETKSVLSRNMFSKVKRVIHGGKERYESSLAAIRAYDGCVELNLIFHDAVRPLVNHRIISDVIAALEKYDAVDVAVDTVDTIISVDSCNNIGCIPPRHLLRKGQTPQAFKLSVIKEAYRRALSDPDFTTTDDCGVVVRYMKDVPVSVVTGEQFNIKLTYKEDLFLIDKLFQIKSIAATARPLTHKERLQVNGRVIVIFGGTEGIGKELADICNRYGMPVEVCSRNTGTDVAVSSDVNLFLKNVHKKYGYIDFVANSTEILDKSLLCDMDDNIIRRSIDTNYLGCVNVAKSVHEYLKETKGSMIFYTSSSYTRGCSMYCLYSSMKAAIVNFVQAISEEWLEQGIRVNCINTGRTKTSMRTNNFEAVTDESLLDPKAVALASLKTLASPVTGEVIDLKKNISNGL